MKTTLFNLILLATASTQAYAQSALESLQGAFKAMSNPERILVLKATQGSCMVVRQTYMLKERETGQVFGRDNQDIFGTVYSVAVRTEAGLAMTPVVLAPWLYDDAFSGLDEKYEPVMKSVLLRETDATGSESDTFRATDVKGDTIALRGLYLACNDSLPAALEIERQPTDAKGWQLWYAADAAIDSVDRADIVVYAQNVQTCVTAADSLYDVEPPTTDARLLGGIYVVPAFTGGGHIAYRLVGMMVPKEGGWQMAAPFAGITDEQLKPKSSPAATAPTPDKRERIRLTPIH